MPKYVIEREIPGAGKLIAEQLKAISQTSCGIQNEPTDRVYTESYCTFTGHVFIPSSSPLKHSFVCGENVFL